MADSWWLDREEPGCSASDRSSVSSRIRLRTMSAFTRRCGRRSWRPFTPVTSAITRPSVSQHALRLLRVRRGWLRGRHGPHGGRSQDAGVVDVHRADARAGPGSAARDVVGNPPRGLPHWLTLPMAAWAKPSRFCRWRYATAWANPARWDRTVAQTTCAAAELALYRGAHGVA